MVELNFKKKQNVAGTYKMVGSLKTWTIFFLSIAFIFYGAYYCKIPIDRLLTMFPPLSKMLLRLFYPPDIEYLKNLSILKAFWETFQIGFLASLIGTILSIPLAWFAAYNMTPSRKIIYPLARFTIGLSRAIDILIWAILFTHIFGFGPLPGILALLLSTIGFAGKLFSEEVEGIRIGPVEAMQATGAGRIQVMYYGVFPQIKMAWIGITIYNWDSIFRSATIIGYVGAGGVGAYLRETIGFMDYHKTGAIIISIILLVIFSELLSAYIRDKIK